MNSVGEGSATAPPMAEEEQRVYHHVDYASKASERRAELEELRKKALAKTTGMCFNESPTCCEKNSKVPKSFICGQCYLY
jgi:hypothetical protein